jgi:[ribosomal protein S18]-alanine N-acetyltransferase
MNKVSSQLVLRDMTWADVDAVLRIEQQVHSHPWTRGNFNDALATGNICKVYEAANGIVGYAVLMPALDEVHLLDISIASAHQRTGLGEKLLNDMLLLARELKFERAILEVRRSNLAANALYSKTGFSEIGVRRGYYPADNAREDAIVMEYKLK